MWRQHKNKFRLVLMFQVNFYSNRTYYLQKNYTLQRTFEIDSYNLSICLLKECFRSDEIRLPLKQRRMDQHRSLCSCRESDYNKMLLQRVLRRAHISAPQQLLEKKVYSQVITPNEQTFSSVRESTKRVNIYSDVESF